MSVCVYIRVCMSYLQLDVGYDCGPKSMYMHRAVCVVSCRLSVFSVYLQINSLLLLR